MSFSRDNMPRPTLPPLPMTLDGDSYIIYLGEIGTKCVKILQLHRFPHNDSRSGCVEAFSDLTPDAKRAIIQQVNRRYIGKTVLT